MALLRRIALVLLMLWLPLQAVAGELLHAHEAAAQEIDHLTHDTTAPEDEGKSCLQCSVAHGFCHLLLNPGVASSSAVPLDDAAGSPYLPMLLVALTGLGADSLYRPPLLRA